MPILQTNLTNCKIGTKHFECSSSTESQVVWRKDSLILKKGTGRSFRKKDEEARVIVDTFSTLYLIGDVLQYVRWLLRFYEITISRSIICCNAHIIGFFYIVLCNDILFIDVSKEEQGNYTCYVDNINMMRAKIIVVSKTRLLTQGKLKSMFINPDVYMCARKNG